MQLRRWGCGVTWQQDGEHTQALLTQPDLVLADYRLPGGVDGVEAVQRVRQRYRRDIPSVVLTGDTSPDVMRRLRATGHRVQNKPVHGELLKRVIHDALAAEPSA